MGTVVVLGLDIGGANLKAATPDGRAVSVPFALWKQPDKLPTALAELVAQFPDATDLAVTMTGELCDCFETKRQGVNAILDAVESVGRPARVWGTDGVFHTVADARAMYLTVAAANWHALATFAGRYAPYGGAVLLVDVGSTTSDVIPVVDGRPVTVGMTDTERLIAQELIYTGVRRTPLCAILGWYGAAEFFATTHDVYVALGCTPEDPTDTDTPDNRPATRPFALARIARMTCGDADTVPAASLVSLADSIRERQTDRLTFAVRLAIGRLKEKYHQLCPQAVVTGSGAFLARAVLARCPGLRGDPVELVDTLGPQVSACAPAYAVAVLAAERRGSSEPGV
jgi:probable H4MPT-linked C1 transfer pathway protein